MKSVLITGCSDGGIGSALAESFQKHGLHVFASARTISKMSNLSKLPHTTLLSLDVTSTSSIAAAFDTVKATTGGKLDYLVNNSGVSYIMDILDTDIKKAKEMFDVNFWGVIAVTQQFAPLVIAAKGTIVNNSSINSPLVVPYMGQYAGSKAAVTKVSETLRLEMVPFGVKVITIITGAIESNIMTNNPEFKLPPGSLYAPVEKVMRTLSRGEDASSKMRSKAAEYAEKVVGDILKGTTGMIWRGNMATMVRFASLYAPDFMMVCYLMRYRSTFLR